MAINRFINADIINLMQPWTNKQQVIKMSIQETMKESIYTNIQTDSCKTIRSEVQVSNNNVSLQIS